MVLALVVTSRKLPNFKSHVTLYNFNPRFIVATPSEVTTTATSSEATTTANTPGDTTTSAKNNLVTNESTKVPLTTKASTGKIIELCIYEYLK